MDYFHEQKVATIEVIFEEKILDKVFLKFDLSSQKEM